MISAGDSIRGPGILFAFQQVDGDRRFGRHFQAAGRELAVAHRGVGVAQVEIAARNEDGQIDDVARADLDDVHVAAVRAGGEGRRHALVGRGADAAEHGLIGNGDLVAPVDFAIADGADVRAVRAVGPEPLGELLRVAGPRGALADRRLDLVDRHGQRIARLGPFDPDRAGLRIAIRLFGLVAAVGVRSDLAAESVFAFDDDRLARLIRRRGSLWRENS